MLLVRSLSGRLIVLPSPNYDDFEMDTFSIFDPVKNDDDAGF